MTKLAIATIVAATALLGSAAPARAAAQTVLTPTDVLVRPGDAVTLRFKAERQNLIRWDLRGVDIDVPLYEAYPPPGTLETSPTPLALTSGFTRPSSVGPRLEKLATAPVSPTAPSTIKCFALDAVSTVS